MVREAFSFLLGPENLHILKERAAPIKVMPRSLKKSLHSLRSRTLSSRPSTLITTATAERDGCSCRSCWLPRVTRRSTSPDRCCGRSLSITQRSRACSSKGNGARGSICWATRRLPHFLIGHPVLSVQQAAAGLSISVPAANAALNNLVAAGIVSLVNERQWGRVFRHAGVAASRSAARPSSRLRMAGYGLLD
jgi:hypothetical protein